MKHKTDNSAPATTPAEDRRSFLKLMGLGAAGSGVAAVTGASVAEAKPKPEGLYRETEHVRTYYDLARF